MGRRHYSIFSSNYGLIGYVRQLTAEATLFLSCIYDPHISKDELLTARLAARGFSISHNGNSRREPGYVLSRDPSASRRTPKRE